MDSPDSTPRQASSLRAASSSSRHGGNAAPVRSPSAAPQDAAGPSSWPALAVPSTTSAGVNYRLSMDEGVLSSLRPPGVSDDSDTAETPEQPAGMSFLEAAAMQMGPPSAAQPPPRPASGSSGRSPNGLAAGGGQQAHDWGRPADVAAHVLELRSGKAQGDCFGPNSATLPVGRAIGTGRVPAAPRCCNRTPYMQRGFTHPPPPTHTHVQLCR